MCGEGGRQEGGREEAGKAPLGKGMAGSHSRRLQQDGGWWDASGSPCLSLEEMVRRE